MNRAELTSYIAEQYGVTCDHPFTDDNDTAVFRHPNNRKWFALVMNIPKSKVEPSAEGRVDVVNLKCPSEIIDSFWAEKGIYPAYHMNKHHWLTILLDGSVDRERLLFLLELSYHSTQTKPKPKNRKTSDEW